MIIDKSKRLAVGRKTSKKQEAKALTLSNLLNQHPGIVCGCGFVSAFCYQVVQMCVEDMEKLARRTKKKQVA